MRQLTKHLATILASIVLGTTLLASGANAAMQASDAVAMTALPADVAQNVSVDGQRPERDGDHHRRFCMKLNAVLTRLVDEGVITREQKVRILAAFGCLSVVPPTTEPPSTARPTTTRLTAAR